MFIVFPVSANGILFCKMSKHQFVYSVRSLITITYFKNPNSCVPFMEIIMYLYFNYTVSNTKQLLANRDYYSRYIICKNKYCAQVNVCMI